MNLLRARAQARRFGALRGAGGQIATIMLLVIVAVLIFVLMTANLGQVSSNAIKIANAADSSALLLGSQLALKSNSLWASLGHKEKICRKGGMLSSLLALLAAAVAVAITWGMDGGMLAMVVAGAVAGATGGAAGAAIAGTSVLNGAIMGGITGAALGFAFGTGIGFVTETLGTTIAGEFASLTFFGSGSFALSTTTAAAIGGTVGAVTSAGSSLYTNSIMDSLREDAIQTAASRLNGLTDYDRFREATVFQAFLQTVDDPTIVQDNQTGCADSDGDGDTNESVPFFQVWWACRGAELEQTTIALGGLTQAFFNGPLTTFENAATKTYQAGGILTRQEIEGADGSVVQMARALKLAGHPVQFWKEKPPGWAALLAAWQAQDCETCAPPAEYDEVDFANDEMRELVELSAGLPDDDADGLREQPIDRVVATWQTWIKLFLDPDDSEQNDFSHEFGAIVNGGSGLQGMRAWKTQIESARLLLPVCTYLLSTCAPEDAGCVPVPIAVDNAPCRGDGTVASLPATGGSINDDLSDEFTAVQGTIGTLITEIEAFRTFIQDFRTQMDNAYNNLQTQHGGVNPITYPWTDSRGSHSMRVQVGPYKIAYIKKKKSGNFLVSKICLILRDHSDDGANTWVRITRGDTPDPSKNTRFWIWNAQGGAGNAISKFSQVSYTYQSDPTVSGR